MPGPPPFWRLPGVLLRERRAPAGRGRVPEPMVMEADEAVAGFEEASEDVAALAAIYHVSARSASAMLPADGQVVDLGCGAGEFVRTLAERRPDCRVLGLDLSAPMVERARARVERAGMGGRVAIEQADATAIPDELLPERIDVVTCLNLLHQLPDVETLDRCLAQIAALRERFGCALWLLDLVRLRHPQTMARILGIFERDMSEAAVKNTLESEAAAFTVEELRARLEACGLGDLRLAADRGPRTWQAHWAPAPDGRAAAPDRWVAVPLPREVRFLARRFRGLPAGL